MYKWYETFSPVNIELNMTENGQTNGPTVFNEWFSLRKHHKTNEKAIYEGGKKEKTQQTS